MLNSLLLTAVVDAFKIPDLRRKLLLALGMLVASRFIVHVSGGALSSVSVAALSVYRYVTAQIIMQVMQPAIRNFRRSP